MTNENEIMDSLEEIKYGWIDKDKQKHIVIDENFSHNYRLQSPLETMNNKIGVCWDQVELERYYFNKINPDFNTYFLCHYDNDKCPTHTFLVFKKQEKFYWFEHSWDRFKGINEYDTLKELLIDIRNKFIKIELSNRYNKNNLMLYEYSQPEYGVNVKEFYSHCESGDSINIDALRS